MSAWAPTAGVRYAELRSSLDLDSAQMGEYFKVKSVQGQSSQGKAGRISKRCLGHIGPGVQDMLGYQQARKMVNLEVVNRRSADEQLLTS